MRATPVWDARKRQAPATGEKCSPWLEAGATAARGEILDGVNTFVAFGKPFAQRGGDRRCRPGAGNGAGVQSIRTQVCRHIDLFRGRRRRHRNLLEVSAPKEVGRVWLGSVVAAAQVICWVRLGGIVASPEAVRWVWLGSIVTTPKAVGRVRLGRVIAPTKSVCGMGLGRVVAGISDAASYEGHKGGKRAE